MKTVTPPAVKLTYDDFVQFPDDGHFAIYMNPDARNRYVEFFRTFLEDGAPTIVGPM